MFPTDKGDSVSEYVSKVIRMISESGYDYQLTAMGTIIETENFKQALDILENSHNILSPVSNRIYSSVKFDIQKNKINRITSKVNSIEQKIGKVRT